MLSLIAHLAGIASVVSFPDNAIRLTGGAEILTCVLSRAGTFPALVARQVIPWSAAFAIDAHEFAPAVLNIVAKIFQYVKLLRLVVR